MKQQLTDFEMVKEYPTYYQGWAIKDGVRLYPTTREKLRTDAQNRKIIASQQKKIEPLTEEERKLCRIRSDDERYRIPDDVIRDIRKMAAEKVLRKDISVKFSISEYQVRRIIRGESYGNVK